MQDIKDLINMPSDQKRALRNLFLTFIAAILVESFFK